MLVGPSFGLNRNHELPTMPINSDVNFVYFDLPNLLNCCAQVVLQRIRGNAKEYIYQPVLSDFGQKRLLITQRIRTNDFWCRIGHLDGQQLFSWNDPI